MRSRRSRPMRVFLGTQEISGLYRNLEIGLVSLGVLARLIQTHPHPFDYGQLVPNPWPARWASAAVLRHRGAIGLARIWWAALYVAASVLLLGWSLGRFDAFVFGWGISILPGNVDIPILRLFGRRVVVVMGHGSEARPPYMATPPDGMSFPLSPTDVDELDARTRQVATTVHRIERWASTVIGLPATAQFFERPFIDFYRLGVATADLSDATAAVQSANTTETQRVTVLHIPSNPTVKGSEHIRLIMTEIIAEHPGVEFRELTNAPHEEVLAAIKKCTFVVDQMWCDIPMGAVGAEAAAEGKATVIGGYGWDLWRENFGVEAIPPTFLTTPDEMKATIVSCIRDHDRTDSVGRAAQRFVRTHWSLRAVAANYLSVLEGNAPSDWTVTPDAVEYGWGNGVPREKVEAMVSALIADRGIGALRWSRAAAVYGRPNET